jgi:hypothetical protein
MIKLPNKLRPKSPKRPPKQKLPTNPDNGEATRGEIVSAALSGHKASVLGRAPATTLDRAVGKPAVAFEREEACHLLMPPVNPV